MSREKVEARLRMLLSLYESLKRQGAYREAREVHQEVMSLQAELLFRSQTGALS